MAVPINTHDFGRFKALADLLKEVDPKAEIRIYISKAETEDQSYIALELTGRAPVADTESIFND